MTRWRKLLEEFINIVSVRSISVTEYILKCMLQ